MLPVVIDDNINKLKTKKVYNFSHKLNIRNCLLVNEERKLHDVMKRQKD